MKFIVQKYILNICIYMRLKSVSKNYIIYTKVGEGMGIFNRFYDKEKLIRKTIEIDNDLYDKLKEISQTKYNTSV